MKNFFLKHLSWENIQEDQYWILTNYVYLIYPSYYQMFAAKENNDSFYLPVLAYKWINDLKKKKKIFHFSGYYFVSIVVVVVFLLVYIKISFLLRFHNSFLFNSFTLSLSE